MVAREVRIVARDILGFFTACVAGNGVLCSSAACRLPSRIAVVQLQRAARVAVRMNVGYDCGDSVVFGAFTSGYRRVLGEISTEPYEIGSCTSITPRPRIRGDNGATGTRISLTSLLIYYNIVIRQVTLLTITNAEAGSAKPERYP